MLPQLNDDCLLHIFQMLDIPDHLKLIEVCEHFKFLIIDELWSRRYRQIYTQMKCLHSLPIAEYKKFFQWNAKNIRKLHIEDTRHFAFTSYLNRFTGRPDFSFYFSLNMWNLKELYCQDQRLHDGYIQMLSRYCPKLEILHAESCHVTEAYIDQFQMLREVKLGDKHLVMDTNNNNKHVTNGLEENQCAY